MPQDLVDAIAMAGGTQEFIFHQVVDGWWRMGSTLWENPGWWISVIHPYYVWFNVLTDIINMSCDVYITIH